MSVKVGTSAFVAGATGLTGRHVVRALCERGVSTIAHVRPDSSRLEYWRTWFGDLGADVSTAAWDDDAMTEALARCSPGLVFALLGTTKRRAQAGDGDYQAVDYGLTRCLLTATERLMPAPLFIYLSAAGVSESSSGAYYRARAQVEMALREVEVPALVARPSFILGNRDESRFGEEVGAPLVDGLLAFASVFGAKRWASRYRSMSGETLAHGLVQLAIDGEPRVVGVPEIKAAAKRFKGSDG